jgi:hypothetical protein
MAAILMPALSKRLITSPMMFFATPSGLIMDSVLSTVGVPFFNCYKVCPGRTGPMADGAKGETLS